MIFPSRRQLHESRPQVYRHGRAQGSGGDRCPQWQWQAVLALVSTIDSITMVYHGEHGLRTLRELGRSYQTLSQDLNRVMNRLKALYRGWSIPCAGTQGYAPRYREEWLKKIEHAGVRRRAELLYQQLDGLQGLRRTLRPELLAESRKNKASKLLRQIPCIGPIRAARLIALMQTPHRFRSKRQLWTYSGLGIETHDSAQS